jgi:signal peptidase II
MNIEPNMARQNKPLYSSYYMVLGIMVFGCIFADQISKYWIVESWFLNDFWNARLFDQQLWFLYQKHEITSFFNIVLYGNTGVSFGFLSGNPDGMMWILAAVNILICAGLIFWSRSFKDPWPIASVGLIVGGALGNLIDRLRLQAVIDFIEVHYHYDYVFPAFNLADSFIFIGAVLFVITSSRQ